jgi:hypothetical protein
MQWCKVLYLTLSRILTAPSASIVLNASTMASHKRLIITSWSSPIAPWKREDKVPLKYVDTEELKVESPTYWLIKLMMVGFAFWICLLHVYVKKGFCAVLWEDCVIFLSDGNESQKRPFTSHFSNSVSYDSSGWFREHLKVKRTTGTKTSAISY